MTSHSQPIQDETQYTKLNPQNKVCTECYALLPVNHFSLYKFGKNGTYASCKECRKQYMKLIRKARYNTKPYREDPHIRIVRLQNRQILSTILQENPQTHTHIFGYAPETKIDYHVRFGPSPQTGLFSMEIKSLDGLQVQEFSYTGIEFPVEHLMVLLKTLRIRLEMTEEDLINVKTVVYYI